MCRGSAKGRGRRGGSHRVALPPAWHQSNLERNSHHYSALRYTGAGAITWLQGTAAGLWFNPNVVLDTQAAPRAQRMRMN